MDNECFESKGLLEESKWKLTIFPCGSLLICGKMLIIAHFDQISYPFPSK
jgi:hypothetical protein